MSEKRDDLALPSIKPAQDEVYSYRKSNRSEAPKQSNFNGILVFVILLMAIMMGIGGYTLFQVQEKLEQSNLLLAKGQASVQELEDRLAATGTDVSKTLQILRGQVDTNVSEIDKLWAVAYRQNRPRLAKLEESVEKGIAGLNRRMAPVEANVTSATAQLATLTQQAEMDRQETSTQIALVRGQVQDQGALLEANRRTIASLTSQMKQADEAIDAIDRYRQQINSRLVDLQKQVQGEAPAP